MRNFKLYSIQIKITVLWSMRLINRVTTSKPVIIRGIVKSICLGLATVKFYDMSLYYFDKWHDFDDQSAWQVHCNGFINIKFNDGLYKFRMHKGCLNYKYHGVPSRIWFYVWQQKSEYRFRVIIKLVLSYKHLFKCCY